jgi:hypothetical protein
LKENLDINIERVNELEEERIRREARLEYENDEEQRKKWEGDYEEVRRVFRSKNMGG